MGPQIKRGQELKKKKPPNTIKVGFQTPQKFLVCCFVAIKVQR